MAKTVKSSPAKTVVKGTDVAAKVVLDAKSGKSVKVRGVGALAHSPFKIRNGVDLLKPVAEQALTRRSEKRRAG